MFGTYLDGLLDHQSHKKGKFLHRARITIKDKKDYSAAVAEHLNEYKFKIKVGTSSLLIEVY